jgi:peptide/nickel transport system permease protein
MESKISAGRSSALSRRMGRFFHSAGALGVSLAITFLGLLAITFVIGRLIPLDPVLSIVGERASEETYKKVQDELGLNLPIWQQFAIYCWNVIKGDFGT